MSTAIDSAPEPQASAIRAAPDAPVAPTTSSPDQGTAPEPAEAFNTRFTRVVWGNQLPITAERNQPDTPPTLETRVEQALNRHIDFLQGANPYAADQPAAAGAFRIPAVVPGRGDNPPDCPASLAPRVCAPRPRLSPPFLVPRTPTARLPPSALAHLTTPAPGNPRRRAAPSPLHDPRPTARMRLVGGDLPFVSAPTASPPPADPRHAPRVIAPPLFPSLCGSLQHRLNS